MVGPRPQEDPKSISGTQTALETAYSQIDLLAIKQQVGREANATQCKEEQANEKDMIEKGHPGSQTGEELRQEVHKVDQQKTACGIASLALWVLKFMGRHANHVQLPFQARGWGHSKCLLCLGYSVFSFPPKLVELQHFLWVGLSGEVGDLYK